MALQACVAVITKTFHDMDTNKDGYLDGYEIEAVFLKHHQDMGQQIGFKELKSKVANFMQKLDRDGDKKISLDEFLDYFLGFNK